MIDLMLSLSFIAKLLIEMMIPSIQMRRIQHPFLSERELCLNQVNQFCPKTFILMLFR